MNRRTALTLLFCAAASPLIGASPALDSPIGSMKCVPAYPLGWAAYKFIDIAILKMAQLRKRLP